MFARTHARSVFAVSGLALTAAVQAETPAEVEVELGAVRRSVGRRRKVLPWTDPAFARLISIDRVAAQSIRGGLGSCFEEARPGAGRGKSR
jgi:hypothetical protein